MFLVPVLVVSTLLGFRALKLAFQRGGALATARLSTLVNNALPIMAGIVVFQERLPAGPFGRRTAGLVMVVWGAALLALPEQPAVAATNRQLSLPPPI